MLVLREKTERPEALAAGVVRLVGTDQARIVDQAATLLTDPAAHAAMARPVELYGDGRAGQRIANVIVSGQMGLPPFRSPVEPAPG